MKRVLSIAAALLVSGGLLYLALKGVDLGEVAGTFSRADPLWLPLLVLLPALDLWVRALRWRLLLAPLRDVPASNLFQLEALGLATNNVLFLRLGELARGVFAAKETGLPTVSALATILVERLCDTAALLFLLAAGAFLLPEGTVPPKVQAGAAALSAAVCLGLGVLAFADRVGEAGPIARALTRFPTPRLWALEIMAGARALRGAALPRVVAFSLSLWLVDAGTFWVSGRALRMEPALSAPQAVAVVAFAAGATSLPAMPGAFGNFEAGVKYVMTRFGYPVSAAVSFAVLSHMVMYLVVTAIGIASLYSLGYSFNSLRKALKR